MSEELKESTITRFEVNISCDADIGRLWDFAVNNNFLVFFSIQRFLEFKNIYPRLIVDFDHRIIQMDGAEVVGGNGLYIESIDNLFALWSDHIHNA